MAMRGRWLTISLTLLGTVAHGQAATKVPTFDVASVRPSQHQVGPDYNNQIAYSPTGITARNVTLQRLIAEAYHLQLSQISGPVWLDRNEYDVEARTTAASTREQMAPMIQGLLAERFELKKHSQSREMRVYELAIGKSGPRIHPIDAGETPASHAGFYFRGDLRQFANLLAVQLSIPALSNPSEPAKASGPPIPVLDQTGLSGIYDFSVDIRPELGTDMFTMWQRALQDQLGLRLENRKGAVEVLVVDAASRTPTEN